MTAPLTLIAAYTNGNARNMPMEDVPNEDAARLSPLKHANLNTLGRHPRPGLRPLRNPADDDDGED